MKLNEESQDLIFIESSGFSMWPFLRGGEKLIIKKIPARNLKIGDIILFYSDKQMVCHRLVKKVVCEDEYLLYACGDAGSGLGELITKDMLIGKTIGILKNGKIISFTGWRRQLNNWLIVQLGPLLRIGIKIIKGPIIFARFLMRRIH